MHPLQRARRFDLHVHTTRSDGQLPPDELLERAVEGGLDALAITDHDLATDLSYGPRMVAGRLLHVIPGAEISGVHAGREYHLLVYFPHDPPASFRDFCQERCRERASRYDKSVASIDLPGLPAADEDACAGRRAITRHHLARELVGAGHASDLRDAFKHFADDRHGHVPQVSLPFVDAIRIAREAGGVTSWAHPPIADVESCLEAFAEAGLQSLEALRPYMVAKDQRRMRKLAKRHGLFFTGGSDWHGWGQHALGLFHVERNDLDGFLAAMTADA